jgi:hypothetical protein
VSMSTALNQIRVNALPAHAFIRKDWDVGPVAVSPSTKLPGPLLGVGFLQVGNGGGLYGLVGKFQHYSE